MPFKAGFATIDITPPKGTLKIGWLMKLKCRTVLDPLFARVAVFESGRDRIAFASLDTLSVRWSTTEAIRRAVERKTGIPAANIMVAATHNHAGPAVANIGLVKRDDRYCAELVRKVTRAFVQAWKKRTPAVLGMGSGIETTVAHNRRVVVRDGTARTHGRLTDPDALYIEGPIDPEVAVIVVRTLRSRSPLGLIVNYASHPTHHGGTDEISAGYPGQLAIRMARQGWPTTLFLNGACGNLHDSDPANPQHGLTKEMIGARLAETAKTVIENCRFKPDVVLRARSTTVNLPFRNADAQELKGAIRGAQRFIDSKIYNKCLVPGFQARTRRMKTQPAEVQVLSLNDHDIVSIPAEYFCENGLNIKLGAWPRHALVASCANGMVGYVPHREAFHRGGYETTLGEISRQAPESGDLLADAALDLIQGK